MGNLKLIFGTTVKDRRSELGMSQEELADRASLHRTYISDVERGARNPTLETIEKLALALALPVAALFRQGPGESGNGAITHGHRKPGKPRDRKTAEH